MPIQSSFPSWDSLPDFGLYMDQLLLFTQRCVPGELTAGMVNSYVKTGLMARPKGKKSSRAALAQLLMIASLKQALPLDSLRRLLHPGDGESAGETKDMKNTKDSKTAKDTGDAEDAPAARALYGQFLSAWDRSAAALPGQEEVSALDFCVMAAAYQQLCRQKLGEESREKSLQDKS